MLKRSIFKVLAILASLVIGFLTLATPASAKILGDFPPSASVITTSGYLNEDEVANIKKQTMQGSEKVVSVYLTDDSSANIEKTSMEIFEAWKIPEDQILFYYEYETEKYNWVAGSEADNFGAAQMKYSMAQAQKYFNKGDVASGISVAVSFSKLQLADPSIFVTGNEAKDAENPIKNGSFFGVFGKVLIGVLIFMIVVSVIVSIVAKTKKSVSAVSANVKEKVSEVKTNISDSSKGYVAAAEENYNDRKKQVQEILEAEKAKSAGSLAIIADSNDNSSNSGASDAFEGGYGNDSDNMNSTGYDYDLTGKKNESPADIFGNWGVNDKNKTNNDDPFGKPTNDIFKL